MAMYFDVTAEELLLASSNCRLINSLVQTQIGKMQTYVLGLMGTYKGTAAFALQQLSDRWGADAKTLNHVLSTIADGLTTNANNYVSHETVNTGNLNRILAGRDVGPGPGAFPDLPALHI